MSYKWEKTLVNLGREGITSNTIICTFFVRLKGLHSSLNLALLLDPSDESSRLLVARIQLHLGVDLDEVLKAEMFI